MKKPDYSDIINIKYPFEDKRMLLEYDEKNRSAQFASFKALSGHEEAVQLVEKETVEKKVLDDYALCELNAKLNALSDVINEEPPVTITYFVHDEQKEGGHYITLYDRVRKIDVASSSLIMSCGREIHIDDIYDIQSKIFVDMCD